MIEALVRELLPHAPDLGLYVAPDIPDRLLRNALGDYGQRFASPQVLALYDATLLGNGKDGVLIGPGSLVFQNNNLADPQEVRYADLVAVREAKKLLGGRRVVLSVNRGRATVEVELDLSAHAKAAPYLTRFLNEVMHRGAAEEMDTRRGATTDVAAVLEALRRLHTEGKLSRADLERLVTALERA